MAEAVIAPPPRTMFTNVRTLIFFGFHIATFILMWFAGLPTWDIVLLTAAMYFGRMFLITAGFHRYFSHRAFKTSRLVQFLFAFLGTTTLQKGVLWWAGHHRHHHRYSDTDRDVHSAIKRGFLWSHMGWIVSTEFDETPWKLIKDFAKYPELRFLNSNLVMILIFTAMCVLFNFGWSFQAFVYGCFVSTILLWHGTFTINSLCHLWGGRRYATADTSRNNLWLALITMGEGWHNNHHYYQTTARQGFRWWEIDMTYYILWVLSKLRIVWDLREVPAEVVDGRLGGRDWLIENVGDAFNPALPAPIVNLVAAKAAQRSVSASASATIAA